MNTERPLPKNIYLDYAATTPLAPEVLNSMLPYLSDSFGNASSVHRLGRVARDALENSRERIAKHLCTKPEHIIFTSGATEANNLALNILSKGEHLITSSIEHKAVLAPAKTMESCGVHITCLPPNPKCGTLTEDQITDAYEPNTRMASVMYVNNETGAISPLTNIAHICAKRNILLHTDAAQAAAWLPIDVERLGVDLMSLSAHKMYGPKGIGILYVSDRVHIIPQIFGGGQERERRGGTENVAAAVGMATAMDLMAEGIKAHAHRIQTLRQELQNRLTTVLGDQLLVNTPPNAAPHILNVAFKPVDGCPLDGEMLLLNMDIEGVYASSGSACASGAISPSHVLLGLGVPEQTARASLRLSLGHPTEQQDIEIAVNCIKRVIQRMRGQRRHEG